jgi:DNA-binding LacI/PurR family transcriptional regulator
MKKPDDIYIPVTIKDVARRAGVSTATVSHVINKTRFVSEETTDLVNHAIEDLGYYPNMLVGSLRKKKTYTIGLVMPSISNETFGQLAEIIQKTLFKCGYNLIISTTAYNLEIEKQAFNTLLMKKVDAVIAIPSNPQATKLIEIKGMGIPIVVIDRVIPEFVVDTVRVDNYQGMKNAISYLIGLGHRHIGYIDRKVDQSHSLEQKSAYTSALEEHGIPLNLAYIFRAKGYDYDSGINAGKQLIQENPSLTAIAAYYDITALGALRGIIDLGYRVPEDISVIGFDGMPITQVSCPRLTSVCFPVEQIAKTACNLLIKRLERDEAKQEKEKDIVLVPELIIRESTTAPRSGPLAKTSSK